MTVTIWHNPACGTSRNTLGLIRNSGEEPVVVEYLRAPPSRDEQGNPLPSVPHEGLLGRIGTAVIAGEAVVLAVVGIAGLVTSWGASFTEQVPNTVLALRLNPAHRVLLLADGRILADGAPEEILAGGWYFATQVARALDGAAVTPEAGAAVISTSFVRSGERP